MKPFSQDDSSLDLYQLLLLLPHTSICVIERQFFFVLQEEWKTSFSFLMIFEILFLRINYLFFQDKLITVTEDIFNGLDHYISYSSDNPHKRKSKIYMSEYACMSHSTDHTS